MSKKSVRNNLGVWQKKINYDQRIKEMALELGIEERGKKGISDEKK